MSQYTLKSFILNNFVCLFDLFLKDGFCIDTDFNVLASKELLIAKEEKLTVYLAIRKNRVH